MKKLVLRSLVVLGGVLLLIGMAGVGPAQATTNVGGLDMNLACQKAGHKSATTVGSTAYDWRCVDQPGGPTFGLDMDTACSGQHPGTLSRIANFYSLYSWQCWQWGGGIFKLNFDTFCKGEGYTAATTVGSTAYDWRCVIRGSSVGINPTRACDVLWTGSGVPFDRFLNFYDKNSWQCVI